jgi:hypothetical protein
MVAQLFKVEDKSVAATGDLQLTTGCLIAVSHIGVSTKSYL